MKAKTYHDFRQHMRNALCSYMDFHSLSVNNCMRPDGSSEVALNEFDCRGAQEMKKVIKSGRLSKDIITEVKRFVNILNENYQNVFDGELIPKMI